ncbi:MAG TPA: Uma2 family endonuclease [Roseiflexaceae bacterium]
MAVINPHRARRVQYPESDGKPLGETDQHRDLMTDLIFALKLFLANVRAYVAGNLFIYFEEGNPKAVVAPDVFVVLGVQQRQRRIYCSWREQNRLPDVVIELTSKKTRKADEVSKPALYARLGVREYFLFDPYGEYLDPRLQGYRLVNGAYQPMQGYPLNSSVLGLELREEENAVRLYNPLTGERLPTAAEAELARRAAEAGRKAAEERLEAEAIARLEAETRAAEQAARAAAAEAELARLRALLEKKGE